MIHSLAGGILSENKPLTFVKVEMLDAYYTGTYWYICDILGVKPNDIVLVPFGKQEILVKGKVLRVDKNVSPQAAPIPVKRAKKVISIEK